MDVSFLTGIFTCFLTENSNARASVLSAFEESSAACISDMLRHVSSGQYLEAIRMAEKFILHVEVLFATIDDLEWQFAQLSMKGTLRSTPDDLFFFIWRSRHVTCQGSTNALPKDGRFVHTLVAHARNRHTPDGHDPRTIGPGHGTRPLS
jgi:hypothetical protein